MMVKEKDTAILLMRFVHLLIKRSLIPYVSFVKNSACAKQMQASYLEAEQPRSQNTNVVKPCLTNRQCYF